MQPLNILEKFLELTYQQIGFQPQISSQLYLSVIPAYGLRQEVLTRVWTTRSGLFGTRERTTFPALVPAEDFSISSSNMHAMPLGSKMPSTPSTIRASQLFISQLACSLAGREMQLCFAPESRVATIYGALSATEHYYCNFGVNPDRIRELQRGPLTVSGSDIEGEVRVIEYPRHPFFIGALFVPQARSTPETPHPLVTAFLGAVIESAA